MFSSGFLYIFLRGSVCSPQVFCIFSSCVLYVLLGCSACSLCPNFCLLSSELIFFPSVCWYVRHNWQFWVKSGLVLWTFYLATAFQTKPSEINRVLSPLFIAYKNWILTFQITWVPPNGDKFLQGDCMLTEIHRDQRWTFLEEGWFVRLSDFIEFSRVCLTITYVNTHLDIELLMIFVFYTASTPG